MPRPLDRRVRRTRRRLKKAILELVRDQPYAELTVQQIIDRADVGRSTFYAHFGSKEDLLLDGFEDVLQSLGRGPVDPLAGHASELFGFSRPLLRHFRAQRRFFLATLTDRANARIRRTFERWLAARIRSELEEWGTPRKGGRAPPTGRRTGGGGGHADEGRAYGIAASFLGVATWWLETREELSVEEVDEIFRTTVAL